MGRQPLNRRVGIVTRVTSFMPSRLQVANPQEIWLTIEELEAIRLKDIEELELEECACEMNVSRTTFSRILGSARKNIADALLNGKAIRIGGGNFEVTAIRRFTCPMGNKWYISTEHFMRRLPQDCPKRKINGMETGMPFPET